MRIEFEKPQALAHAALTTGQTVCIPWGRGGGKSWFHRTWWYLLAALWDGKTRPGAPLPGVRIVLLMPTLVQARKVHEDLVVGELAGPWSFLGGHLNRADWRVRFPGGSWIQWVPQTEAQGQRGLRCDAVSIDEADDIDPEVVDAVVDPWFTEPHSLRMTLVGGTPRRGRYGLLYRTHRRATDAEARKRFPDFHSFHATCYDFPRHVSRESIEKARRGDDPEVTPEIFNREWLCSFDATQGLVYSMFADATHVRSPHPDQVFSAILVGADWGWEDPGCFVVVGVIGSGADASAHVLYEVYAKRRDEDWWAHQAQQIVEWYPDAKWYLDPSRPDRIAGLKTKAGIVIGDVDNAIEDGVDCVANLLVPRATGVIDTSGEMVRRPRLFVAPECANLIREFGLYRRKRDPRNTERILDDIEDKNNHAMDALRYAIFARFKHSTPGRRIDGPRYDEING